MKAISLSKIIFLLALILLCQQLWVPGFFHDGYLYAALGKHAHETGNWLVPRLSDGIYTRFFHHPPLYFMFEGIFFKIFGSDWTQARLFGVFWSLLWIFGLRRALISKTDVETGDLFSLLLIIMPDVLKKARFPNLDFALAFVCGLALILAWREGRKSRWLLAGILLGLGFWIKGIALFLFGPIFVINLIMDRQYLKTFNPYLCVMAMILVGGLWPLLLKSTGNWDIFLGYLDMQFTQTAIEGRGESMPFYTYVVHVLITMPHLILLCLWGIYIKRSSYIKGELTKLGVIWFFSGLVILSCLKFKYSHYLIPYYPGLALMALPGLRDLYERSSARFFGVLSGLTILGACALLFFPLTTKVRRHIELVQMEEAISWRHLNPSEFVLLDQAYEFWSTTNYVAYRFDKPVRAMSYADLTVKSPIVVLANPSKEEEIKSKYNSTLLYRNNRVSILYLAP